MADNRLPEEGDRIAKLLARAGIASRREIERMIYLTLCDEAYGLPDFRMDLEDFLLKS